MIEKIDKMPTLVKYLNSHMVCLAVCSTEIVVIPATDLHGWPRPVFECNHRHPKVSGKDWK